MYDYEPIHGLDVNCNASVRFNTDPVTKVIYFDVFLSVHRSIDFFKLPT